ncbi:MAG: hypothetical protein WAT39_11620 [Planctomycetota bacterium]
MKIPGGFDALFRQITPLVVLGVLLAVVFDWVPGGGWLKAQFGDSVIVRGGVAVLACYVLILWGETIRLHTMLSGVLAAFRQFDRDGGGKAEAAKNPKARLEAARLLIAAMASPDASIRATSRHNLARLVGQDLGDDPAAWQAWLARQESGAG